MAVSRIDRVDVVRRGRVDDPVDEQNSAAEPGGIAVVRVAVAETVGEGLGSPYVKEFFGTGPSQFQERKPDQ